MSKFNDLLPVAAGVRDATEQHENTAARVGGLFVSIIKAIIETIPENNIDGDTISYTTTESNFLITMKKRLANGNFVPITITIPAATSENAGLLTPSLLAEFRTAINSASNAANTAQNSANSANSSIAGISTTVNTLQKAINSASNAANTAQNSANSANSSIAEISTTVNTLQEELTSVEEQVELNKKNLNGWYEYVADYFAVVGKPSGIAPLDALGKVPATHLPAFVDDIVEFQDFVDSAMVESRELLNAGTSAVTSVYFCKPLNCFIIHNPDDGLYYSDWPGSVVYQNNYIPCRGKTFR